MTTDGGQGRWSGKVVDARAALREVRPGDHVFVGSGCAEPRRLVRELAAMADDLGGNEVTHLLGLGETSLCDERFADALRLNAPFIGAGARAAVAAGRADYTPVSLSDVPRLIRRGRIRVDVALVHVSPPDENGWCSYGIGVEAMKAAAEAARFVVAQVNPRMPRTCGDSLIHVDRIGALVPFDEELLEWRPRAPDETTRLIGRNVARLVDDGATIQAGIGRVPDAVLAALAGRKDLGVHTEMFSDGLIDLVMSGAVTGARKAIDAGKIVATFCMGSRRVYDCVDRNETFEFHPADYVGDPFVIARNPKVVAINSAIEVDLTGQVCADSIGPRFISGIGSQVDFVRGAARSEGGRSVIALPSTALGGEASRIVPTLREGAGVMTTRGDVEFVVTEWGVADLAGRSIRERALELIGVAHPRFRPWLLDAAKRLGYAWADQCIPAFDSPPGGEWESTFATAGGLVLRTRPARPPDERGLTDLLYALSEDDVRMRFMGHVRRFPRSVVQPMVVPDCENRMALVATVDTTAGERILGVAHSIVDPATRMAEVAFIVAERWRRMGIGTQLLRELVRVGGGRGVSGLRAEMFPTNQAMIALFRKTGRRVHAAIEEDTYVLWCMLDE